MKQDSRVLHRALRSCLLPLAALLLAAASTAAAAPRVAAQDQRDSNAQAQALALEDFQKRLQQYLDLRESLSRKLKPLSPTADSAELAARQESLAVALREARRGAKRGDLIPQRVAVMIRHTVTDDFRKRPARDTRATLEEVPEGITPVINKTYPQQAALPTVPPLLLGRLPKLPDNLQYRFFDRHIVLLDGDTQIITDYVTNVLPPH